MFSLLWLACADPRPTAPPPLAATQEILGIKPGQPVHEVNRVSLIAVGDIMMHGMVKRSAKEAATDTNHEGYSALFTELGDLLKTPDIAFGNLETPIAPDADKGSRSMVFNAPVALLPALEETGFDVVSFANNHVYDQGRDGLIETIERLDASGLQAIGAAMSCEEASKATILEKNGLKIAFIGSTDLYNSDLNADKDEACVFTLQEDTVVRQAKAARKAGADAVVLSVHWGQEYHTEPMEHHAKLARRLIRSGVDVVLGHHPHVLQPIEVVQRDDGSVGVVAFSLGNFISNQSAWYRHGLHSVEHGNPRDGLALSFSFVKKDYGKNQAGEQILRTELADLHAIPLWTTNNTQVGRKKGEPVMIRVQPTAALHTALLKPAAPTDDLPKRAAALQLLEDRWSAVSKIVGRAFLPPQGP